MANITEVSQWENVIRQLENGEAATGGADGLANVQAKQLANRTKWLKDNYLPLTGGALNGNSLTWNGNDLAGSAIEAKSLSNNGYVRYASGLVIQWFSSTEITIAANTSGSYIKTTSPIAVTTPLFCMGSIGTVNNTAKIFLRNIAYEDGHTVHHQCMNIDNVETKYFVRYLFIGIA